MVLIPRPRGVVDSIKGEGTAGRTVILRAPKLGAPEPEDTGAVDGLCRPRGTTLGVDPKVGDWRGEALAGGCWSVKVDEGAGDQSEGKIMGYRKAGAVSASGAMERLCIEGTEEGM